MLTIYEKKTGITKEDFEKNLSQFKDACNTYNGLDDKLHVVPPQASHFFENVEVSPIEHIVYSNIPYKFVTIESEQKKANEEKKANEKAESDRIEEQQKKDKEDGERLHKDKMTIGGNEYDHDYARTQEYYSIFGVNNKMDGYHAQRDYEHKNGIDMGNELIKSVKDKWPK